MVVSTLPVPLEDADNEVVARKRRGRLAPPEREPCEDGGEVAEGEALLTERCDDETRVNTGLRGGDRIADAEEAVLVRLGVRDEPVL